MVSKGKRQYLIAQYVTARLPWNRALTGKHRSDNSLVREVATKGFYDGVKRLNHDECDLEIFHTIVKLSPTAQFLTIHRNKERAKNDFEQKTI